MITLQETATHLIVRGDAKELEDLALEFRYRPNNYYYATSYQHYRLTEGKEGWDGYQYPMRRVAEGVAKLARGRKADLFRYAEELVIEVNSDGLLENPFISLEIDDVRPDLIAGKFQLDPRQRQCILEWLRAGVGFCKVTVGGGKTETFAGAAALIKEQFPEARFIYITPSERLVRQSTERLKACLPKFDIGQFGGGKHQKDATDLVVCTVSMLNHHYRTLLAEGWFESFMVVLYDEVHHAASATSQAVLEAIPAFYRLGASDTAKEKDPVKYFTIRGLFGPKLMEVKSHTLIEIGRLAKPHIYVVDIKDWRSRFDHVGHRPVVGSPAFVLMHGKWTKAKYKGPVYEVDEDGALKTKRVKTTAQDENDQFIWEDRPIRVNGLHTLEMNGQDVEVESRWCLLERLYDRAIIQYKPRNELIVKWAQHFHEHKWPTVVVATRTTHVYILEAMLKKAIDPDMVRILTGYEESSSLQRDEMFSWFKNTPGAVLVTPLIKEGVSINEIKAMVVADHVADYEVARQIIGRAMRPKGKKDNRAHVVWFWDRQNSTLSTGCRSVLSYLEKTEGYEYYHPCAGPETVTLPLF